jgi:hypothetical protein
MVLDCWFFLLRLVALSPTDDKATRRNSYYWSVQIIGASQASGLLVVER